MALVKLAVAAVNFGKSERTMARWAKTGELEIVRIGPRDVFVDTEKSRAYQQKDSAVSGDSPGPGSGSQSTEEK